jgi:AcrR family transcriptional regulator
VPRTPADADRKRQHIVESVVAHLLREGFRNSNLRALAASAGMSDRMVMYYFETKESLISEAILMIAENLQTGLDAVLPDRQASGARIVSTMVDSALTDGSRETLRLWFEIVGLAVRGDEPYLSTAQLFLKEWESWIEAKLPASQKHRAPALLAQIEGEVMIQLLRAEGG